MKQSPKKPLLFKAVKGLVRLFYPKMEVIGTENLPDEPCIIVGNHSQLHGPIAGELFFDDDVYIWCAAPMMKLKEVPKYAYNDFWSQKPKIQRPFFKAVSYLMAPLSVLIFNNARTVAVYHDKGVINTFRESVKLLQKGKSLLIFPEYDKKYNNILCCFQEGFVDLAKLYGKRTGKEISFVPLYIAPKLKKMYLGKPVKFSSHTPLEEERRRICDYITNEITGIARSLPPHTVVPYRNIAKRKYPKNTEEE